jgi:23S rRNA (adenine2503-C2)-methyltransferase
LHHDPLPTNETITQASRQDIRKLSLDELKAFFTVSGEPAFRAKQVHEWLWKKSATDFDRMTNLSVNLREFLKEHFVITTCSRWRASR